MSTNNQTTTLGPAKGSIQTTLPKYSSFVKLSNSAQSDLERISVLHLLTGEKPQDLLLRIGGGDCKIGISLEHFAFNRDEAFECIGQAINNAYADFDMSPQSNTLFITFYKKEEADEFRSKDLVHNGRNKNSAREHQNVFINSRNVVNQESENAIQGELAITALNNIGVNDTQRNTQDETQNQTQYDEDEETNSQPPEERNYEKNQTPQNIETGMAVDEENLDNTPQPNTPLINTNDIQLRRSLRNANKPPKSYKNY
ncbi:hypothetical protein AX774_g558 [Zancudomyces culisetae]|uniref:Uncharacterized protein n=1 Tax=Zancudomyces culisetae TaxID=1213189 RepID=A0A1R1PY62_ZANCU|nr:hypothetical protein AX774_g558 [Zancudomyces culisetae]|eukprot:OMH85882.1 hypothetical protein AX774_g558 [Zancudomyces culisetae]